MSEPQFEIERFVATGATPPAFEVVRGIPGLPVDTPPRGTPCLVALVDGRPAARLATYVRDDLAHAPGRSGLVGHYESLDARAGAALLLAACGELAERGAVRVLGPMNGSTWFSYRLALPAEPSDPVHEPPVFTSEPRNPFDYPDHFEAARFTVVARYESRLEELGPVGPVAGEIVARVAAAGFGLRPLDLGRFDDELSTLHALSLEAFAENAFYTPIDEATFRALYEPLRSRMDPAFVTIVHDRGGRACGFLFAFADPLGASAGRPARVIVKTLAVSPAARGRGLGGHLLDAARAAGRARGLTEVIHALMHVKNVSMHLSERASSQLFRRYALWEWTP